MIRNIFLGSLMALLLMAPACVSPGRGGNRQSAGRLRNWSAYSTGTGSSMTCYAMSKPRARQPKATKRGAIFLMVSDWPGRKVKAEPEIVPGYEYKAGAPVTLGIGGTNSISSPATRPRMARAWLQISERWRSADRHHDQGVSAVAIGNVVARHQDTSTPIPWRVSATRSPRFMPSATCDGRCKFCEAFPDRA